MADVWSHLQVAIEVLPAISRAQMSQYYGFFNYQPGPKVYISHNIVIVFIPVLRCCMFFSLFQYGPRCTWMELAEARSFQTVVAEVQMTFVSHMKLGDGKNTS